MLGAPEADAPRLHEWSHWVQRQFDVRALGSELPRIERATAELYDYVEALLEQRRAVPAGDLLSTLLAAREERDRLSHPECVNLVLNVLAGGIDTTQSQLAHAMRLFAGHPDQWALLATHPELIRPAVDRGAAVRADHAVHRPHLRGPAGAPGGGVPARDDRGGLRGAGQPRAGRRRARPGRRRGRRWRWRAVRNRGEPRGRLLTFGAGPHFCLGANLARAELEEALAFLVPRMPGLAEDGPAELGGVEGIYGVVSLPLRWSAGCPAGQPPPVTVKPPRSGRPDKAEESPTYTRNPPAGTTQPFAESLQ